MSTKQIEKTVKAVLMDTRCRYITSSGRRCRNLAARDTTRASGLSAFCLPHSQLEQQYLNTKSVTKELLGDMDNFRTAVAVNDVLGRLFILQAQNRIPVRNAMALAYTAQVILSSLETVRAEVVSAEGEDSHDQIIQTAIDAAYGRQKRDEEESGEQIESDQPDEEESAQQNAEPRNNFQAHVAAAVKILDGK